MKYAHFADVHIGSWREPKLNNLSTMAFVKAVDFSILQNVDFILIAGDLFNTSLPTIDKLKTVVNKLRELKRNNIPVYIVAGSHDYSPSGKTMLEVIEEAGLCRNVVRGKVENNKLKLRFTHDKKTGAKITGMIGKRGMLEKSFYEALDINDLEREDGYKIFMFHTALSELKPKDMEKMESTPISYLPRGFNYYAGGHVHIIKHINIEGYDNITYPGALFPANFKEMEEYGHGGLYIIENEKIAWHPIKILERLSVQINADYKNPFEMERQIKEEIKGKDLSRTIVTLRVKGCMSAGKISEINFKHIFEMIYEQGAYFVMKNTNKLYTAEFEEIKVKEGSTEEVEELIVKEHLGQIEVENMDKEKEEALIKKLIDALDIEKQEGEKNSDFEVRVKNTAEQVIQNI